MANISLKRLFEAEDFKAKSKETGKLVHFKSKDSYQAALKAGTHEDPNAQKGGASKGAAKPNDMFGGDYSKDRGGGSKSTPSKMGVDSVVYNKRTKTVGIVRMADERGETKTDADGNVNTDELEPYNPMKYPHQKDAQVAPSTTKEIDSRGLYKPFAQDEPVSKPKEARKGNPTVNKEAKKKAEEFGITPQKLGKDGYQKAMYQAAVEALTDANFHSEARELISKIEGKPEWAKKVDYPSMDDPKYKEKMADIRTNGVDSSEYWGGEDDTHEFARKVAASSGWDGVDAADGIAFTLRMNGFHKEADMIQSVFDDKPYMKNEGRLSLSKMMNEDLLDIIPYFKKKREAAAKKQADIHYTRKELAYNNVKAVYDTTIKALDNPKYSQDKDAKIKACNDLIWTIVSGAPKNEKINWTKLKTSYDWDELNEFGMMDTIEQTFAELLKIKK
jgi:hypothetical protein